jgi:hypothetical protein
MSGSAPKPYPRLVCARSVPTGGATAAAPATAAPAAVAAAAAPAARSFGAAKPRELVTGVDVQAQKLDQRTKQLNNAQQEEEEEEEFKELESLLASAIATAASEDASVVREWCVCACVCVCVCVCVHMLRCMHDRLRPWRARSPSGATPCGRR